jgi:hypothetical protein
MKGKRAKNPRTIAGARIVVRSIVVVVRLITLSSAMVELVTKGTYIHLINPLRVRYTG